MAAGKEYQMMFQIGANLQGQFNSSFKGAQSSVVLLQNKIDALNKTQGDVAAYQKQQTAVERTKSKLEMLQQQYTNLKAEMDSSGAASASLKNQLLSKQQQIEKTSASLETQTTKLDAMGNALTEAGVDTGNLKGESVALSSELRSLKAEQVSVAESTADMGQSMSESANALTEMIAAAGLMQGLKAAVNELKECTDASIEFESVMTGVDKTTDLTAQELITMSSAVKNLSTEIPVTTTQLGEVMEVAGQLGTAKGNILDFSTTMSMLSTATNMTASNAATMSAQFANITQMDPSYYSNLGSTVVDLGNKFATTEEKILDMGQGIAAAGSLAGMSEADMMAISASVTSLGIETQAGATSVSKLITEINTAVETGEGLTAFASISNMTASEFTTAWGQDAAGALSSFITGLADTERNGMSAAVALQELNITEARMQRMILSLANSGDLMTSALTTANSAWSSNTALVAEAEKRYGTTESKMTMASNSANNFKIALGNALTPAQGAVASAFTDIMRPINDFIERNPALVQAIAVAGGVIGAVTFAITAYSSAAKLAAAASALFSAAIPGLNVILAVTAGVAALAGGAVYLSSVLGNTSASFEDLDAQFDNYTAQIQEQQHIIDLCDEYRNLSAELDTAKDSAEQLSGVSGADIKMQASVNTQLAPDEFVDGTDVSLTGESRNVLSTAEFIESTDISFTADIGNLETLQAQVASLETQASAAKSDLVDAETALTSMTERYDQLGTRLENTTKKKDKSAIEQEMEDLSTAIETQKGKVGDLETAYTTLDTELDVTKTATTELTAKQERLAAVKDEIVSASGGLISATEAETGSFEEQLAVLESIAEAKKVEAQQGAYDTVTKQSKAYAQSIKDGVYSQELLTKAQSEQAKYQDYIALGADGMQTKLQGLVTTISGLSDEDGMLNWDGTEVQEYTSQVEDLLYVMTGEKYDFQHFVGMADVVDSVTVSSTEMTKASIDAADSVQSYATAVSEADATQQAYIENLVAGVQEGGMSLEQLQGMLTEQFSGMENGTEIVANTMQLVRDGLAAAANAENASEGMDDMSASAAELEAAMAPILTQMEELSKVYDEAYQAAYSSMEGQFDLFEKVKNGSSMSVSNMIANMQTQEAYMQTYAENLQTASKMGVSDGLLAELSDGSTQSAAYLETIVSNGSTKIDELNAAFTGVSEGKETFATTVAEMETDFSTSMAALQTDLETTITNMDMSSEAATAGKTTVNAFAKAAEDALPAVTTAFGKVAAAATAAMSRVSFNMPKLPAYASGTTSAERGYAIVGENGPELVIFKGGEQVLNAEETAAVAEQGRIQATSVPIEANAGVTMQQNGGNVFNIKLEPQFDINGDVNNESLMEVLRRYTEVIRNMVVEVIEDVTSDNDRSVYA